MSGILRRLIRLARAEDGPTAVEYAVMLALILVASITIVASLGSNISGTFSKTNAAAKSGAGS